MIKFAKLFESNKYGQILILAKQDEENTEENTEEDYYCLTITFYKENVRAELAINGINGFNKVIKSIEDTTLDLVEKIIFNLIKEM